MNDDAPALTVEAIAELNQGTGPMPELSRIVDEQLARIKPEAKTEERLRAADQAMILATKAANFTLLSIGKQHVDGARNCLRTIAADDTHDPELDLRLRELWSECEWLMQDMAKLYGERFYVAELPPVKASIKGQLRSERL